MILNTIAPIGAVYCDAERGRHEAVTIIFLRLEKAGVAKYRKGLPVIEEEKQLTITMRSPGLFEY